MVGAAAVAMVHHGSWSGTLRKWREDALAKRTKEREMAGRMLGE